MNYQGRLNDGSSVQKHSAGGLYPYVIFAKDTPFGLRYGVLCPNGHETPLRQYDNTVYVAEHLKSQSLHMTGKVFRAH